VLCDDVVAELDKRIRPTVGGDVFLISDPVSRAVSVLAAIVAAVLGHKSCPRLAGKQRVVRADAYQALFDALDLGKHFDAAREVLESSPGSSKVWWSSTDSSTSCN
jgi:hypothetical protein